MLEIFQLIYSFLLYVIFNTSKLNIRIYRQYNKDLCHLSYLRLIRHFHQHGRHEFRVHNLETKESRSNKSKTIYIYTPKKVDDKSGGVSALYKLKCLIDSSESDFKGQIILFDQNVINIIPDNEYVIYPEIVNGNPLNARNVVRWILLALRCHPCEKGWEPTDIVFQWLKWDKNVKLYRQLYLPFRNTLYVNKTLSRTYHTCCLIKKASLFHNMDVVKQKSMNLFIIDKLNTEEIISTLNSYKYFYTFDAATAYVVYAIICGCIPIIEPIPHYSKREYIEQFCTTKHYNLKHGFAYGTNREELDHAEATRELGLIEAQQLLSEEYNEEYVNDFILSIQSQNWLTIQDAYPTHSGH